MVVELLLVVVVVMSVGEAEAANQDLEAWLLTAVAGMPLSIL